MCKTVQLSIWISQTIKCCIYGITEHIVTGTRMNQLRPFCRVTQLMMIANQGVENLLFARYQ